jgi:hypothetical protein
MNDDLGDLISDLQHASGGAARLRSQVLIQGHAEAAVGSAVDYPAGPGLRQAFTEHPIATGKDAPERIGAHMANSLGDGAVQLLVGD